MVTVTVPTVIFVVLIVVCKILNCCCNNWNRWGFKNAKNINLSEASGYQNPIYDFQENENSKDYTQLEKTIPLHTYTELTSQPVYQEIGNDNSFKKEPTYFELEKVN